MPNIYLETGQVVCVFEGEIPKDNRFGSSKLEKNRFQRVRTTEPNKKIGKA